MLHLMNTRNYVHSTLYGISNAVYDRQINLDDFSYNLLKKQAISGSHAIVIRYKDALKLEVEIDTVLIANTCVASYIDGSLNDCLVVVGEVVSSETMTKVEAAQAANYSKFFDKNGNFKTGKSVQFTAEM